MPQPFQSWEAGLELTEFYRAGLPKSCITVVDDRALPEGTWHPGMASRLGRCKIVPMAGSHEVMFTRREGRALPQSPVSWLSLTACRGEHRPRGRWP